MKKRALTLCLACAVLLTLLPTAALAAEYQHDELTVRTDEPGSYALTPESEGSEIFDLVLRSGAHVTLGGDGSKFNIFVEENAQDVIITLDGFSSDRPVEGAWGRRNGIVLQAGSSATIALVGDNTIRAGWESCAIQVCETASLTIDGEGTLNASINNGSNAAYSAVIGSRYTLPCGNITINGGTINAHSASSSAAAIGAALWQGKEGACGTIAFNGGVINANAIGGISRSDAVVTGSGRAVVNTDVSRLKADISGFNGIMWNGEKGTVCGNAIANGLAIEAEKALTVPDGAALVISENETLTINGAIILKGTVENSGAVTGEGKIVTAGGSMSGSGVSDIIPDPCTHESAAFVFVDETVHKKVCLLCDEELGEAPHSGGSVCPDCGYGADPIGENACYIFDRETKTVHIYGEGDLWDREEFYDHYEEWRKWREISYEVTSVLISPHITAVNDVFQSCYHLETVCAPEGLEVETDSRVTKLTYEMTGDGAVIKSITLGDGRDSVVLPAELNGKPVLTHPHIGGNATCSQPGVCAVCGQTYTLPHTSSDWIIDKEATSSTAGSKHKECTICGYVMETEVIPATGQSSDSDGGQTTPSEPSASVDGEGGSVTTAPDGTVTITSDNGYQIEKITVNGQEVEIPADGNLTGLKPTDKVVVTFAEIFPRFTDVAPDAWYYDTVKYAVEHGLFYGTSDTAFSPGNAMTRGMLTTVIYRMENEPAADPADFLDVESGQYYSEAVAWAAANGIVAGYGNGNFGPEDFISREQLAAILWRYSGFPASSGTLAGFADAGTASGYALDALRWAVEQKYIYGRGNGILDPRGWATRAEVAAVLTRFCKKTGR